MLSLSAKIVVGMTNEKKRILNHLRENPRDKKAAAQLYRLELRDGERDLPGGRNFHFRAWRVSETDAGYVFWTGKDSSGKGPNRPAGELKDCTCIRITGKR